MTDPLERTWSASYNSAGLLRTVTDPAAATNPPPYNGPLQTLDYNSTRDLQLVTQRALDSETTAYQVDLVGRVISVTSPMGATSTINKYDDKDEVLQETDPNGYLTNYTYDWNGDVTSLTDPKGNTTTWNWTPPSTVPNWNVKECDPSQNCALYLVENTGSILDRYTDKRGVVDSFDYDTLDRMTAAHYDANGQLGGTVNDTFAYDTADRMIGITHPASATSCTGSDGNNYTDSFVYDFMDDVQLSCTPEGQVINGFDGIGMRGSMVVNHALTMTYTWDDANELTAIGPFASFTYSADDQRQTLSVLNGVGSTVTTNYSYDPASERLSGLTYASTQNPSLGNLNYSYDADGRVIGKSGSFAILSLPFASGQPALYASTNQIQTWTNGVSPMVDANRSLKTDPVSGLSYSWDAKDKLLSAGNDSYQYDAGGRRESVTSGGSTTSYLYDGTTPVEIQVTGSSPSTTNVVAAPGSNEILVSGSKGGGVPLHDALGSVLGWVGPSGSLTSQNTYDPFGNFTTSGSPPTGYGNVYGMAGIEYDPSGLYNANARYYSPALQRFISEDPERGKVNLFSYAGNNAITGSDVSGRGFSFSFCASGDCGGGGSGADPGSSVPIVDIAQLIFNFLESSSSSSGPPTYFISQHEHQGGLDAKSTGTNGNRDIYTVRGNVLLVQMDEDGGDEEEEGGMPLGIGQGRPVVVPSGGMTLNVENYGRLFLPGGEEGTPTHTGKGNTFAYGKIQVRIMRPVTKGRYQHPNGYVVFEDQAGNPINPNTGERASKAPWHYELLP